MTLTEFLAARLDEDEARIKDSFYLAYEEWAERMLREVRAKRRILDAYEDAAIGSPTAIGDTPDWFEGVRYALIQITVVYSDHPDYQAIDWG